MNAVDHEQLKDIIRDIVGQSHQSIANVQSNSVADIKTILAVHTEKLDNIVNYQKIQNGNVARAVSDIEEDRNKIDTLNQESTEIKSSFRSFKWVAGIASMIILTLIGTITTLSLYVYAKDKEDLAQHTNDVAIKADNLAIDLKAYQDTAQEKQKQIIELLKTISTKR